MYLLQKLAWNPPEGPFLRKPILQDPPGQGSVLMVAVIDSLHGFR